MIFVSHFFSVSNAIKTIFHFRVRGKSVRLIPMNNQNNTFSGLLLDFIKKSPSPFHVVDNFSRELLSQGFEKVEEGKKWNILPGKKYFVTRNNSSIISFSIPKSDFKGFMITASHSDSPSFKIKENPELHSSGYLKLNVEKYGGMLMNPWFDRPLSAAGRVILKKENDRKKVILEQRLVNLDQNLLMIPNLAIHMNRDANDGHKINVQNELMPILSANENITLKSLIAKNQGISPEEILSYGLFLYNREEGIFWGGENEFISSPKLDDLACAYSTFKGFLQSENKVNAMVHCVFDNEETGSQSRQGAASTFLADTLQRINFSLGRSQEDYLRAIADSFMVSADNAHGIHPNFESCADPVNRPKLNGGIVIKFNAAQKYTSDGPSAGFFKAICSQAGVPYQIFTNNSNVPGGSTLGNISNTQVSLSSVDIGLAQWAMHSPFETCGAKDPELMARAIAEFYQSDFELTSAC